MERFKTTLKLALLSAFTASTALYGEVDRTDNDSLPKLTIDQNFTGFTGKISKNKVRMRTGPTLEAPVARELNKGELLIVVGETEEFYAVQPPSDIKGYVFRTFVLDNKVEGSKVNVRIAPNTEAPVIGQLSSGDPVDGVISALNNKWLEITPPANSKFYVAKEYIEKIGDQHFMAKVARRRDDVNALLNSTYAISQQEFQKPFPEIKLDRIQTNYQQIIKEYPDFPEQAARAKELLEQLQENYLKTKIAYLESKVENRSSTASQKEPIVAIQEVNYPEVLTHINYWKPHEEALYAEWSNSNQGTQEDFYNSEKQSAQSVTGVLEPYSRMIKNKPGDFMLVDKSTHAPIAFLYSTSINLQNFVGREVTFLVSPRTNNNFAYPAYYVHSTK